MIRILHGDCRDVLKTLPEASVQCCVTSPPYYGLRDYGTAQWDGGDPGCDHARQSSVSRASSGLDGATATQGGVMAYRAICGKCGSKRIDAQIGLEASPDAYVAELVSVFREVRRVLRDDGTLWLNLGDSYAANRTAQVPDTKWTDVGNAIPSKVPDGLKPKDLIGIPWMVAFALRADGWWLRSDIIWAKPNPMPESVTDRPTSAHEHVFLLAKAARYFWDAEAVREEATADNREVFRGAGSYVNGNSFGNSANMPAFGKGHVAGNGTRNIRNVWTIATAPFAEAHFATFPPELAERCIKAGSRPGDTILDPFSGAGTTSLVADRLGRDAIGIELNPDYSAMAHRRVVDDCPLFAEVAAS